MGNQDLAHVLDDVDRHDVPAEDIVIDVWDRMGLAGAAEFDLAPWPKAHDRAGQLWLVPVRGLMIDELRARTATSWTPRAPHSNGRSLRSVLRRSTDLGRSGEYLAHQQRQDDTRRRRQHGRNQAGEQPR